MNQEHLSVEEQDDVNIKVRHELDQFRESTIAKAVKGECEGCCEDHRGVVKAVRVSHISSGTDWGYFSYCEEAIETDTRHGMRCVEV